MTTSALARLLPPLAFLALACGPGCVRRASTRVEYVQVAAAPTPTSQISYLQAQTEDGSGGGQAPAPAPVGPGRYVLVGSDAQTHANRGDTPTSAMLPVLCFRAAGLADPGALIGPDRTPGGAVRRRWSGGEVALTEPMAGQTLTSRAVADQICNARFGGGGWRMAEFHDGGRGAGWDFWAYAPQGGLEGSRFWVAIDDQRTNPWDSGAAMTWVLLRSE